MKTIECNIEVDGFMVDCQEIKLTADESGTLTYLYHLARTTDLKMLDDESFETLFFEWLEDHHPLMAQSLIGAAEDRLVDLLAEDFDGYYRDNIPHEPPYSIDSYWTIQPDLKYNIMPYNLTKWESWQLTDNTANDWRDMVRIEFSNSKVEGLNKSVTWEDYKAERFLLYLSNGRINPAVLNEGPCTLRDLSYRDEDNMIFDTITFIPQS